MSRNGAGVYSKPAGSTAVANTTVESAKFNTLIDDLVTDANTARPVVAGGTGATTATAARVNLDVPGLGASSTVTGNWTVSGNWTLSGTETFSGVIAMAAGTAALPSATYTGDLDTGFWHPSANTIGISTGGTQWWNFSQGVLRASMQSGGVGSMPSGLTAMPVQIQGLSGQAGVSAHRASADTVGPAFHFSKSRGTTAGDVTIVHASDTLGGLAWWGADGTTDVFSSGIFGVVTGSPGVGDIRSELQFLPGLSTGPTKTFVVGSDGSALSVHATGGIGYGTGAGGTVTQLTSKSTGVTLNKITGKITTHNAALAATTVFFTVTNSAVLATDVVVAAVVTPASSYSARISAVSAGSFQVALTNLTGGGLSDAVDINFAVIRSATA